MRAYVLIKTEAGKATTVQQALQGKPGIHSVDLVIGPHDIVITAEAADLNAIGKLVLDDIHGIGGVVNTLTCPVIESGSSR
jgi:DNA-binding Lrp family transcriptional regulator